MAAQQVPARQILLKVIDWHLPSDLPVVDTQQI
jgi:hypothetical protein